MAASLVCEVKEKLIPREILGAAQIRRQSQGVNAAREEARHG